MKANETSMMNFENWLNEAEATNDGAKVLRLGSEHVLKDPTRVRQLQDEAICHGYKVCSFDTAITFVPMSFDEIRDTFLKAQSRYADYEAVLKPFEAQLNEQISLLRRNFNQSHEEALAAKALAAEQMDGLKKAGRLKAVMAYNAVEWDKTVKTVAPGFGVRVKAGGFDYDPRLAVKWALDNKRTTLLEIAAQGFVDFLTGLLKRCKTGDEAAALLKEEQLEFVRIRPEQAEGVVTMPKSEVSR